MPGMNPPDKPSLHNENWRAFSLEKEENSSLARDQWSKYRKGLRRLEQKYAGRVPVPAMRRALVEDAFFCATHWKHNPKIVRLALRALLKEDIEVETYTFAAAELWTWARAVSPADLPEAEAMLKRAREDLATKPIDSLTRKNLNAMLAIVVERNRPGPIAPDDC